MSSHPRIDLLSPADEFRRDAALDSLLRPGDAYDELVILASFVKHIDVVAGTSTLLRVLRHLRAHPAGRVSIEPPRARTVAAHYVELLSPLPAGLVVTTAVPSPQPRHALLAARAIESPQAARDAGAAALDACDRARISEARSGLVAAAVMELADNALQYAVGARVAPVVAATVSGRDRFVEVAVSDLGIGIAESDNPVAAVRAIPGARGGEGFLARLLRLGVSRGVGVTIEVLAGTGRLRWTPRRHRAEAAFHVPGTTVIVSFRS